MDEVSRQDSEARDDSAGPDEVSRRDGEARDHPAIAGSLGVLASVLDFLRYVVANKTYTSNLVRIFAGTTLCLIAMIVVVAYTAPDLKALFVAAAGVTGTATITIQVKATAQRRQDERDRDERERRHDERRHVDGQHDDRQPGR